MIARSALASSKLSPFLGAASLIAILFLVVIAGHAEADVGDSDRLGFLPGRSEWITRDLVEGTPISVCSSDFPNATRAAVSRWNAALGIIAFRMLPSANNCKTEAPEDGWNPRDGVDRVTVSRGNPNCPEADTFCGDFVRPDVLQDGGKVRCSTASSRACMWSNPMQAVLLPVVLASGLTTCKKRQAAMLFGEHTTAGPRSSSAPRFTAVTSLNRGAILNHPM